MSGSGTWVLLRGLTRDARHWGGFPARLARELGVRVVMPDLPGNGRAHALRSPWRMAGNVDAVRAVLARECVPLPCRVLALSLGAMAAVEWARRHPHELGGLVLVNTSLGGAAPLHRRLRPAGLRAVLGGLLRGDAVRRERAVLAATSNLHRPDTQEGGRLVARWADWSRHAPVARANAVRQLASAACCRAMPPPAVPVLLLAATGDRLVDVRCSRALATAWRCPLREHPDAGHDLPLDDPGWVIAQVRAWRGG